MSDSCLENQEFGRSRTLLSEIGHDQPAALCNCELVVFCRRMYQWYGGFMVPASLAFRAGGQPEKRLLLAHHRSLDCLHVPAKQLPSRAPVLPSPRDHHAATAMETKRKRKASDDGLREAKARPPRSRVRDVKHKWSTFNSQAARRGIAQCLNYDQYVVLIRMPCAYCGHCPLDGFVGIDRIDSTKRQYCLLNCLPCCATCNFMKGSIDHHVFLRHVRAIASWRTGATFE